jgi:hypothetical protein
MLADDGLHDLVAYGLPEWGGRVQYNVTTETTGRYATVAFCGVKTVYPRICLS